MYRFDNGWGEQVMKLPTLVVVMAHLDDGLSYHDGRIAVRGKWLSGLLIRLIEGCPEVDHMHAIDRRLVCDERRVRPGEGVEAEARTDRVDVGPKLGDLADLDRRDPRDEGVVGERDAEGERRPRGPDEEADCPRESSEDPREEHRRQLRLLQRANRKTDLVQVLGRDHSPEDDR